MPPGLDAVTLQREVLVGGQHARAGEPSRGCCRGGAGLGAAAGAMADGRPAIASSRSAKARRAAGTAMNEQV